MGGVNGDNYITKRMRIRDIVTVPPSVEQEQLSYIKQSIKKLKQSATSLNLLTIMNGWNGLKRKEITKFILIISNYNEVDELLAKWLVEQFLLVIKKNYFN